MLIGLKIATRGTEQKDLARVFSIVCYTKKTICIRPGKFFVKPWTYYKWTVYDLSFFDHDDRHRHLAVRILMTTSKWLDNDDYVIM